MFVCNSLMKNVDWQEILKQNCRPMLVEPAVWGSVQVLHKPLQDRRRGGGTIDAVYGIRGLNSSISMISIIETDKL